MSIFNWVKPCNWWIKSKTDSRWNQSGQGSAGFGCCPELDKAVEELKEKYGEPPKDCEVGWMKH